MKIQLSVQLPALFSMEGAVQTYWKGFRENWISRVWSISDLESEQ